MKGILQVHVSFRKREKKAGPKNNLLVWVTGHYQAPIPTPPPFLHPSPHSPTLPHPLCISTLFFPTWLYSLLTTLTEMGRNGKVLKYCFLKKKEEANVQNIWAVPWEIVSVRPK